MARRNRPALSGALVLLVMPVSVMGVGIMSVSVPDRGVSVPMGMRLAQRVARSMGVLMMIVTHMAMLMRCQVVQMLVRMRFSQVQPNA